MRQGRIRWKNPYPIPDPTLEKIQPTPSRYSPNIITANHLFPHSSPFENFPFSLPLKISLLCPSLSQWIRTAERRLRFTSHLPKNPHPIHQYQPHRQTFNRPGQNQFPKGKKVGRALRRSIYTMYTDRSWGGRGGKGGESETERKQRRSFNDIVRVSPEGPATVPPRLRGTSAADVGCRLVRAGWYYSEPFVTRPTRQPLSFSRHPLARPLSRVFIAANRRNMPTRGLPRSSRELEDRLRRGEFSVSSFFTHPLRPFSSSFARKDFLRPDRSNGLRDD